MNFSIEEELQKKGSSSCPLNENRFFSPPVSEALENYEPNLELIDSNALANE